MASFDAVDQMGMSFSPFWGRYACAITTCTRDGRDLYIERERFVACTVDDERGKPGRLFFNIVVLIANYCVKS